MQGYLNSVRSQMMISMYRMEGQVPFRSCPRIPVNVTTEKTIPKRDVLALTKYASARYNSFMPPLGILDSSDRTIAAALSNSMSEWV